MYKRFKVVAAVHMILLLILLSISGGGIGCNGSDEPDTVYIHDTVTVYIHDTVFVDTRVEHDLYIKRDGQRCKVVDANGNTDIYVNTWDFVTWHNEYGQDVELDFGGGGNQPRLFGVKKAIAYATGPPLSLQVRADATSKVRNGMSCDCGCATLPGPVIIVNPPN